MVAKYAEQIAREMGIEEDEIKNIRLAGLLHDIGKIGTYDYLLDKAASLTEKEFEIVKNHPEQGVTILRDIKKLKKIIPLIRHHHERINGRGYPNGLKGEEIPLGARILHVADSYDSMTSDRPYRPAPGKEYAISELKKHKGTQFDPEVVDAFLKVLDKLQE
jgi:putative nucleotidyltransferase with HDIG domain